MNSMSYETIQTFKDGKLVDEQQVLLAPDVVKMRRGLETLKLLVDKPDVEWTVDDVKTAVVTLAKLYLGLVETL